jgi:two-component system, OmpR family, phosphate regulon sensor histidine kinase PhoR
MQPNIRSIFIIMMLCIIGTNAFQGYWLYQAYQRNIAAFEQDIQVALMETIEQNAMEKLYPLAKSGLPIDVEKKLQITDNQIIVNKNTDNISSKIIVIKKDSTGLKNAKIIQSSEHIISEQPFISPAGIDTLARKVVTIAMQNKGSIKVNIADFSQKYKLILAYKNITAPFQLDTFNHITLDFYEQKKEQNDKIKTRPMPLHFMSDVSVQATFDYPNALIFKRMPGLLLASLLLLVLTTWCFIYMLRTIIRQKKLAEIKNDFINNMTHELRTPVATVSAAIEAMQKYKVLEDESKTQQYLAMSSAQLARLSDLIDDVLTTAVEDQKDFEIQREPLNLSEAINDLLAQHQLKSNKEIVVTKSGFEKDVWLNVDVVHFPNVLSNLIDNAIKYSDEKVFLNITYSFENQHIIKIADKGKGIAPVYLNLIFDKFFRVPTGDLHNVKGFGLGLAYVKKVVTKHGGNIVVKSEIGKGTTFVIKSPI